MPAFSSSCAPAFSSTPVMRKRERGRRSSARRRDTRRGSRASTRIGTPCGGELGVVRFEASAHSPAAARPSADPVGLGGDALVAARRRAQRQFVAKGDQRGRRARDRTAASGRSVRPGRPETPDRAAPPFGALAHPQDIVRRARRRGRRRARRSASWHADQHRQRERDDAARLRRGRAAAERATRRQRAGGEEHDGGLRSTAPNARTDRRPASRRWRTAAAQCGHPTPSATSSTARPIASGSAIQREAPRRQTASSRQPSTSASAGNIGRMYDGSFDPESAEEHEHERRPDQAEALPARSRCALARVAPARAAASRRSTRQPRAAIRRPEQRHEVPPGAGRAGARSVRKRWKCSWMKKNCGESGLARDTSDEPRRGERQIDGEARQRRAAAATARDRASTQRVERRASRRGSRARPVPWSASRRASAAYATSIQLRRAARGSRRRAARAGTRTARRPARTRGAASSVSKCASATCQTAAREREAGVGAGAAPAEPRRR